MNIPWVEFDAIGPCGHMSRWRQRTDQYQSATTVESIMCRVCGRVA